MSGEFRQKYTFLRGCIATANNKDFFSGKELAVTGGAVGNAPALVFFLTFETYRSGVCAGCQQDAKTAVVTFIGVYRLDIPGKVKAGSSRQYKLRTEVFRLLLDSIR